MMDGAVSLAGCDLAAETWYKLAGLGDGWGSLSGWV